MVSKNHPDRKPENDKLFNFVSSIFDKIKSLIDPVINLEGGTVLILNYGPL